MQIEHDLYANRPGIAERIRADERVPRGMAIATRDHVCQNAVLWFPGWGVVPLRDVLEAPDGMAAGYQGA